MTKQTNNQRTNQVPDAQLSQNADNPGAKPQQARERLWTREFLLVVFCNFFLFCGFNMLSTLLPIHFHNLGAPASLLGLIAGVWTVACILMRPFVGAAVDRFGRRGILALGLLVMALSSVSYFAFPILSLVLIIRFIQGVGWAMANTASPTLASDVIPRSRFAEGMAWFGQGNALASILAPWLSLTLLYSFGAGVSVLTSSAFLFFALICVLFIGRYLNVRIKPGSMPAQATRAVPASQTQAQDSARAPACPASAPSVTAAAAAAAARTSLLARFAKLIERRSLLPASVMFFATACLGAVNSFMPLMAADKGIEQVPVYFLVEAGALFIVRPFIGKVVDRSGYRLPGSFGLALLAAAMLVLGLSTSLPALLIAAVFQGMGYGLCYATFQTMAVADIEPSRRGAAMATFYVGFDGGMGLGALLAGLIVGLLGFQGMYLCWAAVPLLGLLIFKCVK
jgi:MFS family permease